MAVRRGARWSAGSPPRAAPRRSPASRLVGALAWAWWPDGQYQPVRGDEDWTVAGARQGRAPGVAPAGRRRRAAAARAGPAPGDRDDPARRRDRGAPGALRHPRQGQAAASPSSAPTRPRRRVGDRAGAARAERARPPTAPSRRRPPPGPRRRRARRPRRRATRAPPPRSRSSCPTRRARATRRRWPPARSDGGVTYDIAYAVVTVKDGADVDQRNGAYALASCKACTTVAVSFQVVLVVGQSDDDRAGQRRRGAERRLPVLHHRRVRPPDRVDARLRCRRTSCCAGSTPSWRS